jgi:predicted transcriptional regulator
MSRRRSARNRGGRNGHEPAHRVRNRELRAVELSVQGWTQAQIARELSVTQPAVSRILRRAEERLLAEASAALQRHKMRQTLRLEHLYAESVQAWERSKADSTRRRQRRTDLGAAGTASVAELVTENQHGDPRYLEQARRVVADLTKLWRVGERAPEAIPPLSVRDELTDQQLWAQYDELSRMMEAYNPRPRAVPSPGVLIDVPEASGSNDTDM